MIGILLLSIAFGLAFLLVRDQLREGALPANAQLICDAWNSVENGEDEQTVHRLKVYVGVTP